MFLPSAEAALIAAAPCNHSYGKCRIRPPHQEQPRAFPPGAGWGVAGDGEVGTREEYSACMDHEYAAHCALLPRVRYRLAPPRPRAVAQRRSPVPLAKHAAPGQPPATDTPRSCCLCCWPGPAQHSRAQRIAHGVTDSSPAACGWTGVLSQDLTFETKRAKPPVPSRYLFPEQPVSMPAHQHSAEHSARTAGRTGPAREAGAYLLLISVFPVENLWTWLDWLLDPCHLLFPSPPPCCCFPFPIGTGQRNVEYLIVSIRSIP